MSDSADSSRSLTSASKQSTDCDTEVISCRIAFIEMLPSSFGGNLPDTAGPNIVKSTRYSLIYLGFSVDISLIVPGPKTSPMPVPWSATIWGI